MTDYFDIEVICWKFKLIDTLSCMEFHRDVIVHGIRQLGWLMNGLLQFAQMSKSHYTSQYGQEKLIRNNGLKMSSAYYNQQII